MVRLDAATVKFLHVISYALPNFENFNVMGAVAHGRGVPGELVLRHSVHDPVRGDHSGSLFGNLLATESEMMSRTVRGLALGAFVIGGMAGVWSLQGESMPPASPSARE